MDALRELDKLGAVMLDHHFVYKSKKHGSHYINPDPMFPHVSLSFDVCSALADPFLIEEVNTVASAATGGVALAMLTALSMVQRGHSVAAVWADKDGDDFVFERATFVDFVRGKKVLVVDDLMINANEVGTVYKVCRLVEQHDGEVIGVSIITNRCNGTAEQLRVPRLEALADITFTAVEPEECELCKGGVPIVADIGHGPEFKELHPDYPGGYITLQNSAA